MKKALALMIIFVAQGNIFGADIKPAEINKSINFDEVSEQIRKYHGVTGFKLFRTVFATVKESASFLYTRQAATKRATLRVDLSEECDKFASASCGNNSWILVLKEKSPLARLFELRQAMTTEEEQAQAQLAEQQWKEMQAQQCKRILAEQQRQISLHALEAMAGNE